MTDPTCPICCEVLGNRGGPTTLPCGHNGCLECMQAVQVHRSDCPLCRAAFDKDFPLTLNTQLRDLISTANRMGMDDADRACGWEAFPTAEMTARDYYAELMHQQISDASPSAPPIVEEVDMEAMEPPLWMPDSSSAVCMGCRETFLPIVRRRHHCRLCGRLFCHECSSQMLLLPHRFQPREPQRVCDLCAAVLKPWQERLREMDPRSARLPVCDTFDWCSLKSWLNIPYSHDMEYDIYKATNILKTFHKLVRKLPGVVPEALLRSVKGVVVLSEVKIAFGVWSYRLGTGLIMAKTGDSRNWSRPCSLSSVSVGAGLQIGGQLMDVVILLPTAKAVEAFTGERHVGLSGGASASLGAGPGYHRILTFCEGNEEGGRLAEGHGFCFCRGALIGASLEGSLLSVRHHLNDAFYGMRFTPRQLLTEPHPPIPAATHLLRQMDTLFHPLPEHAQKGPDILVE